jgi:hypothetical protein
MALGCGPFGVLGLVFKEGAVGASPKPTVGRDHREGYVIGLPALRRPKSTFIHGAEADARHSRASNRLRAW